MPTHKPGRAGHQRRLHSIVSLYRSSQLSVLNGSLNFELIP
jgi:hypothetical protein